MQSPDQPENSHDEEGRPAFKHADPVTQEELDRLAADRLELEAAASKLNKKAGPKFVRPEAKTDTSWQRYTGLGVQLGAAIALFTLGGKWLDGEWDTSPTFTAIGALLGTFGGMYAVIRTVASGDKKANRKKKED